MYQVGNNKKVLHFNVAHFPCKCDTYIISNSNFLYNVLFVSYLCDVSRPQFFAVFGELANFSTCAAYASTYVAEILHVTNSWGRNMSD